MQLIRRSSCSPFTLAFLHFIAYGLLLYCRPFLLQANASYTQIGIFSLASYPYSFKLFWSPIVDSVYSLAFGRRKSWIVSLVLESAFAVAACSPATNPTRNEKYTDDH